jgi:alkanesulfonate monooxygenase SsuD/methylene tetrahydromethanopterin reductase-like flavin-dependent oxidoreductase (luciferase family)
MEAAIQLILKLWAELRTTFHGRYFHVEDAILEPKPDDSGHAAQAQRDERRWNR